MLLLVFVTTFLNTWPTVRLSPAVSHDSLNSASSSDLLAAANDPLVGNLTIY